MQRPSRSTNESGAAETLFTVCFFFFNDTATTEIYTLSLHDALPIWCFPPGGKSGRGGFDGLIHMLRSEEHTSELQSPMYLVCRLLLEKKILFNVTHSPPSVHSDISSYCTLFFSPGLFFLKSRAPQQFPPSPPEASFVF